MIFTSLWFLHFLSSGTKLESNGGPEKFNAGARKNESRKIEADWKRCEASVRKLRDLTLGVSRDSAVIFPAIL
ncbi:hypothetical protein SLA2020_256180 [Shorea laevis]